MSLLPSFAEVSIATTASATTTTAVTAENTEKEYAVDIYSGQLTGERVDGIEAVKTWIWKCLMTERFIWPIYSWAYGTELEKYIGHALMQEYLDTDLRLAIEDALYINPQILRIYNYAAKQDGAELTISFQVLTIFGELTVSEFSRMQTQAKKDVSDYMAYKYFEIDPANGHLVMQYIDNASVKFRIDGNGRLILQQTPEFAARVTTERIGGTNIEATTYV